MLIGLPPSSQSGRSISRSSPGFLSTSSFVPLKPSRANCYFRFASQFPSVSQAQPWCCLFLIIPNRSCNWEKGMWKEICTCWNSTYCQLTWESITVTIYSWVSDCKSNTFWSRAFGENWYSFLCFPALLSYFSAHISFMEIALSSGISSLETIFSIMCQAPCLLLQRLLPDPYFPHSLPKASARKPFRWVSSGSQAQ